MKFDEAQEVRFREARLSAIGASEVGVLMGIESFGVTELDIYLRLVGRGLDVSPDEVPDFRRGHLLEPMALRLGSDKVGVPVDYPVDKDDALARFRRVHPAVPLAATPDGVFLDGWLAEAKAPRPATLRRMLEDGIPPGYQWQMQAQLACYPDAPGVRFLPLDIVEAAVFVVEVERDEDMITRLVDRVGTWWADHVGAGVPPGLEPREGEEQPAPVMLAPQDYTVMTGDSWAAAVDRYSRASQARDAADADMRAAQGVLQEVMKEAGLAKVAVGGHRLQYAPVSRRTFKRDLLQAAHPDLDLDPYYVEGAPSWTFRYYPPKGGKR